MGDPLAGLLDDAPKPAPTPAPQADPLAGILPAVSREDAVVDAETKNILAERTKLQARVTQLEQSVQRDWTQQTLLDHARSQLARHMAKGIYVDPVRADPEVIARGQREDLARNREAAARHDVVTTPGLKGLVSSGLGTVQSLRSMAGTLDADAAESQNTLLEQATAGARENYGPVARFGADMADALGGVAADVPTVMLPGGAVARTMAAGARSARAGSVAARVMGSEQAQLLASGSGFGVRSAEQKYRETGSVPAAMAAFAIEAAIPAAFGRTGAEHALLAPAQRQALRSKMEVLTQALVRHAPAETLEEVTQELANITAEYLQTGNEATLDPAVVFRRLAVAGIAGFGGGLVLGGGADALAYATAPAPAAPVDPLAGVVPPERTIEETVRADAAGGEAPVPILTATMEPAPPVDPLDGVVPEAPAPAPAAPAPVAESPLDQAARLEQELVALGREYRKTKDPAILAEIAAKRQAKVAADPRPSEAAAGEATLAAEQTIRNPFVIPEDVRRVEAGQTKAEFVAGPEKPLKPLKPGKDLGKPAPVVESTPEESARLDEIDRLVALSADETASEAVRKAARERADELIRAELETPTPEAPTVEEPMRSPGEPAPKSPLDRRADLQEEMARRDIPPAEEDALARAMFNPTHESMDQAAKRIAQFRLKQPSYDAVRWAGSDRAKADVARERRRQYIQDRYRDFRSPGEPKRPAVSGPAPQVRPKEQVQGVVELSQTTRQPSVSPTPPAAPSKPSVPDVTAPGTAPSGRPPTPKEIAESGMERFTTHFHDRAIQVKVGVADPTGRQGIAMRVAPVPPDHNVPMQAKPVNDLLTEQVVQYAPPMFHIGQITEGRLKGQFVPLEVRPETFNVKEGRLPTTIAVDDSTLLVPKLSSEVGPRGKNQSEESYARYVEKAGGRGREVMNALTQRVKALREARQDATTFAENPAKKAEAVERGIAAEKALQQFVAENPELQGINAPYWPMVASDVADAMHEAAKRGDRAEVSRLMMPTVFPTYEAALEHVLASGRVPLAAARPALPESMRGADEAILEQTDREAGGTGFQEGKAADLKREPDLIEKALAEGVETMHISYAEEKRAVREARLVVDKAIAAKDPVQQKKLMAEAASSIERSGEVQQPTNLPESLKGAFRPKQGAAAQKARAEKSVNPLLERSEILPTQRIAEYDDKGNLVQRVVPVDPELRRFYKNVRDLAPIPGLKSNAPKEVQRIFRLAQIHMPGVNFEIVPRERLGGANGLSRGNLISVADDLGPVQLVATLAHEMVHQAFNVPGVREAVLRTMRSVLGEAYVQQITNELVKSTPGWRAYAADMARREMSEAQFNDRFAEEVVSFAIENELKNGNMELAKAIFAADAMHETLPLAQIADRLDAPAPSLKDPQRRTVLGFLRDQFQRVRDFLTDAGERIKLAAIGTTPEKEAALRADQQLQLGTENDTYKMGQDQGPETVEATVVEKDRARVPTPELSKNLAALSEAATLAIHKATGRLGVIRLAKDGAPISVQALEPTTELGKALHAEFVKTQATLGGNGKMDYSWMPSRSPGDIVPEGPEAELPPETREERFEGRAKNRARARENPLPVTKKSPGELLRAGIRAVLDGAGDTWNFAFAKYRKLGWRLADPDEAHAYRALDTSADRLEKAPARAQSAILGVAAPMLAAKDLSPAERKKASDTFADLAVLKDVHSHITEVLIPAGLFVKGRDSIPLMRDPNGSWKHSTDWAEFEAMIRDAEAKTEANPVAQQMYDNYNAVFDQLHTEARRQGVMDEWRTHYFHRMMLDWQTPDRKERAKLLREAAGKSNQALIAQGMSIFKTRAGANPGQEFNLDPYASLGHAVTTFERAIGRAEFVNELSKISKHNIVAKRIIDHNQANVEKALAEDGWTEQTRDALTGFFGSLLHSETALPEAPWVDAHEATIKALRAGYSPVSRESHAAVTPAALRALASDAVAQAPPRLREMLSQVILGGRWISPNRNLHKTFQSNPEFFEIDGNTYLPVAAPARIGLTPTEVLTEAFAADAPLFDRALVESMNEALAQSRTPMLVLKKNIAEEVGSEREIREANLEARAHGKLAPLRKASVFLQLRAPWTLPRYLFSNYIGNPTALMADDPAALAYKGYGTFKGAADVLLNKLHNRPETLTEQEKVLVVLLHREGLVGGGLAAEYAKTLDPTIRKLHALVGTNDAGKFTRAYDAYMLKTNGAVRYVDDVWRIAQFMRELSLDPYFAKNLGDAIRPGAFGRMAAAATGWMRMDAGGASREVLASSKASDLSERSGSLSRDLAEGRRISSYQGERVRGTLGHYTVLSRLAESWLGRGLLNPYAGYPDNIVRQFGRRVANMVTEGDWRSVKGLTKKSAAVIRGSVMLAAMPMIVRLMNEAISQSLSDDDDKRKMRAFMEGKRTNPWTDVYLGEWGGQVRTVGLSSVASDFFRATGVDTAARDIKQAHEYLDRDFTGNWHRAAVKIAGRAGSYLASPQVAYADLPLAMAGQSWNAERAEFQPSFDPTRQVFGAAGMGGFYDLAKAKRTGATATSTGLDLLTRPFSPSESDIATAKESVQRFNAATGRRDRRVSGTIDEETRYRVGLRQALARGDALTAAGIIDELYSDPNIGPDNLLKSFGASSVLHGISRLSGEKAEDSVAALRKWLSAADERVLDRALEAQDRLFNPWKNPQLKSAMLSVADKTPDISYRTARAMVSSLVQAVTEARKEGMPLSAAVDKVAKDLGLDRAQVVSAVHLRDLDRDATHALNRGEPSGQKERDLFVKRARERGFTK